VRVLAATNRPLEKLVQKGTFRRDLYYRINVVNLSLPRLKERREDIPLLIEHFIAKCNGVQNKQVQGVSDETLAILMRHDYPGNVRELENIIEHAFVLCRSGLIEPRHLPTNLTRDYFQQKDAGRASGTLSDLEAIHITDALRRHNGNRSAAARELGINPSTLYRKIKHLKLELPGRDGRFRSDA